MRNIETKVRCPDLDIVRNRVRNLDDAGYRWSRRQVDTYFRVPNGRLKLRLEDDRPEGTLIAYYRADETAIRDSIYQLLPICEGAEAQAMLAETLGVLATVDKRRELYLVGETRIHLDQVDGLGEFVELETVVGDQTGKEARGEHERVFAMLGLGQYDEVPVSYSDLMLRQG